MPKTLHNLTRQLLLIVLMLTSANALTSQHRFAAQAAMGDRQLELLGSGVLRFGLLIDVYAAALYVEGGVEEVLAGDRPRRLELHYYRQVEREQIIAAAEKVLRNQLGEVAFAGLQPALDRWHESLRGVAPGDRYVMEFDGRELQLILNGRPIARSQNRKLADAYFGIWLNENPISPRLRKQLLQSGAG